MRRHDVAALEARIDAKTRMRRRPASEPQRARARDEVLARILGADARLDRVPARTDLVLCERQPLAGGDAQLPLDEVEAGDELGDRVLDLQARVHLHEVELAASRHRNSTVPAPR